MKALAEQAYLARLEAAVAAAQSGSRGEILVVVEAASETYRDVDRGLAAVVATLALAAIVFAPDIEIEHAFVLPILAGVYVGISAIARRLAPLRRLFVSRARRVRATREAARLAFFEENVAASPERSGVLLYVSLFERDAEVIADVGLQGKVGEAVWNGVEKHVRSGEKPIEERLLAAVAEIGTALAGAVPAVAGAAPRPAHPPRVRP